MELALKLLLIAILFLITYQDMKMRLIHILLPLFICGLGLVLNWDSFPFVHIEWGYSLLFLSLNFIVVFFYFSVRKKAYTNPFDTLIGWGDVLFLVALIPLFTFRGYIQFFVLGLIFSLILFWVMKWIFPTYETIPLAGFLSLFLIGITIIDSTIDHNFLL